MRECLRGCEYVYEWAGVRCQRWASLALYGESPPARVWEGARLPSHAGVNDGATAPLAVRDAPKTGPFLAGATEIDVQTVEEALDVLNLASENRRISSTAMNKQSSRSHLMFILMLKFKEVDVEKDIENVSCAKFNMVDLAGSERQSKTKVTG